MSDNGTRILQSARNLHANSVRSIQRYAQRARIEGEASREAWLNEAKMEHGSLISLSVLLDSYGTKDDKLAAISADNESRFLRHIYARTK
jgi:hypothetical protein